MEERKKTTRQFMCRDVLWSTFEQMARDFDCSTDYLINEAMRFYARSKNYQGAIPGHSTIAPPDPSPRQKAPTAPPPPPRASGARPTVPQPSQSRPQPPQPSQPPTAPPPEQGHSAQTLYLMFDETRYPISKDQFIIGRGTKTSDLPIKDGNISRKHAAVIRRNGTYYIKDLGSTNGIDFKGMRIDNKRIDEGDVFHLCDYELRFTYRDS